METLWKKWTRKKKKGKYKMQFDHIKDYKVKITFKERNRLINQKKKQKEVDRKIEKKEREGERKRMKKKQKGGERKIEKKQKEGE